MTVIAPKTQGHKKAIAPKASRKVTVEKLAEAFGATSVIPVTGTQNPLTRWQLARELQSRLTSSGGRPTLEGADTKIKVSLLKEDLSAIQKLSEELEVGKYSASPSQVATILVHMALSHFSAEDIKKTAQGI